MRVVTHPAVTAQVEGAIAHPGGTLLLHGPRMVGKRTLALEMARRLNCQGCTDETCRSCRMAASGNHPNIVVVQPDEKGKIGVEPVHELQHGLQYRQYEAQGQRTVIISGADTLTLPAQHALLKTLEEPPPTTTIILTSGHPQSLLATVLSRCRMLYVPPVPAEVLQSFVQAQAGRATAEIVRRSHGLPGRAQGYMHHPERLVQDGTVAEEVEQLLAAGDLLARLGTADRMAAQAHTRSTYLEELAVQVRAQARQDLARGPNLAALERLLARLRANVTPRAAFEALAVELA